ILTTMAELCPRAGRAEDAASHLRESLLIAVRAGGQMDVLNGLDWCGHLCATTGRPAEAVTLWSAHCALSRHLGFTDPATQISPRREPADQARQVLGDTQARAAEDRGTAMSTTTAAEFALTH